jgi:alpha-L-fucosidase 2
MFIEQGFENLMTFQHIGGGGRMLQVDGSMATPGLIAEMLLQSHLGEIHLLPALPKQWPKGNVQGLVARGGSRVDIEWNNGRLARAVIRGPDDKEAPKIRIDGEEADFNGDPRITYIQSP